MKLFAMLTGILLLVAGVASAQEQKEEVKVVPSQQSSQSVHPLPARQTFRLDYTITEMEDGKKVNARTYSVMCEDEGGQTRGVLKVGSRIPVTTGAPLPGGGPANFTYLDVGMNIESRLSNIADGLSLQSDVEMSSVADSSPVPNQASAPVIRQLRVSSFNAITVGRPVVIATADDVASHRQFQIQVVATKLK